MTRRKEPRRPRIRRTWIRNPAQRTHSTPKGTRGYARQRARKMAREEFRVSLAEKLPKRLRIAVLVSGKGSQLTAILSLIDKELIAGEIVAVISDTRESGGVRVASDRGIKTLICAPASFAHLDAFGKRLSNILDEINPDVVVLDNFASPLELQHGRNRHVVERAEALLEIAAMD